MEHALSGGPDGRRVVDPFLADVGRVLAPDGRAYLLVSSLTDPGAVRERARAEGLAAREVAEEAHPYERLVVLELRPG
jgi:release factor glutamine methyltransferase